MTNDRMFYEMLRKIKNHYCKTGKVDKSGESIYYHVERVIGHTMTNVGTSDFKNPYVVTAMLHDLIEDGMFDEKQLKLFLIDYLDNVEDIKNVYDAVVLLTRNDNGTTNEYFEYIKRIKNSGNKFACLVKKMDLIDNLRVMDNPKITDKVRSHKYQKSLIMLI